MKDTIIIGDTLNFSTAVSGYSAADGYVLHYRLVPRVAGTPIDIVAGTDTDGEGFLVNVAPAVTGAYFAGEYTWYGWVELAGARYNVDQGLVTVLADPTTATIADGRTHAAKVLDALEALIEGRASQDQMEYSIGSRHLKRMSPEQLVAWRDKYRGYVYAEAQRELAKNGYGSGRVTVRL